MRERRPSQAYFNYQLDSQLWEAVPLREGDVILASAPKVGSTWTLRILATLIHGERLPAPLAELSPWVDRRFAMGTPFATEAALAAQAHQRSMRSHLPFDALPYDPKVRYVCVARDPRDTVLSLHNHYRSFTDQAIAALNAPEGAFPVRFERATDDLRVFIREWLTRPNPCLPWETEGYPSWSLLRLVRTFWDQRRLPNVLLVHYSDLKTDLAGEAERLAHFIGVPASAETIDTVLRCCSFEAMREDGASQNPGLATLLEGGSKTFYNKGVSGGWRDVFTADELDLYRAAMERNLPPDGALWLERGRLATGIDPAGQISSSAVTAPGR